MLAHYESGIHGHLVVWLVEHHDKEAVVLGNATLGNTMTPKTNLQLPSPIQSVSSS